MTIQSQKEFEEAEQAVKPYLKRRGDVDYSLEIDRRGWYVYDTSRALASINLLFFPPDNYPQSVQGIAGRAATTSRPFDAEELESWAVLDGLKQIIEWEFANPLSEDS